MTAEQPPPDQPGPGKPGAEAETGAETPVEDLPTPGEVRVRFGLYGAGVMMMLCFLFQSFFPATGSEAQRVTALGLIMLAGFIAGWLFARIRF
ncbi:hypothetical protein Pan153_01680 [Gimesia panareensis]|uniref:Uncharacterized protein n=1 Tax=Gimesia panareensis TaxID=2527978 RepID=A0A518FGT6_9PLAN|nr:hypothetical protein [Gimesia panareensis]QDV15554.1 hypothetical protein Pan153_01680 [Gimesia panareensis]